MASSQRPYQRREKRLALMTWLIFQLLILAVLIAPLYFYQQRLFGRTDYAIMISGLFAYVVWTWYVATRKVAEGIRNLPEQGNDAP